MNRFTNDPGLAGIRQMIDVDRQHRQLRVNLAIEGRDDEEGIPLDILKLQITASSCLPAGEELKGVT